MNRAVLYAIAGALLVLAGWVARAWYEDSLALAVERAANAAQQAAAKEIQAIEVKNTVIHQKIVEHTFHEPVYMECRHTPEEYNYIKELFK